jgi:hypothetical protein
LIPILCESILLDSRTCFILHEVKTGNVYIWQGKNSQKNTIDEANLFFKILKNIFKKINKNSIIINEDKESKFLTQFKKSLELVKINHQLK